MAKLTEKAKVNIIEGYELCVPVIELAKTHSVSRHAVYKVLRAAGIDTTHKRRIPASCTCCQKEIYLVPSRIRKAKRVFCSRECYFAFLEAGQPGKYIENRQGVRIARRIIAEYFPIESQHVPHHKDRNQFNNAPHNLLLFRNQGDHIRFHRGFEVEPLWDGASLI